MIIYPTRFNENGAWEENEQCRVWAEEEIKEVKQVAKLLLRADFKKAQIAHLLDVSTSSIYNWIKKGEI